MKAMQKTVLAVLAAMALRCPGKLHGEALPSLTPVPRSLAAVKLAYEPMSLSVVAKPGLQLSPLTRERLKAVYGYVDERRSLGLNQAALILLGDIQKLYMACRDGNTLYVDYGYSVSTGAEGFSECGFEHGKTPSGLHVIWAKAGQGLPLGRALKSRLDTGKDALVVTSTAQALAAPVPASITTRVLVLSGREDGNRDTYSQQVYIHGTSREYAIGSPDSSGCVRMKNASVAELFDLVPEGTPLYIDSRKIVKA